MTPEQAESLQRHRERMALISAQSLASVAKLAEINAQAILENGTIITQRRAEAMQAAIDAIKGAMSAPGDTPKTE